MKNVLNNHLLAPVMLFMLYFLCAGAVWAESEYLIKARKVPDEFNKEFAFLELLKLPHEPQSGFNANDAPNWNLPEIMRYISPQGISFSDVNNPGVKHIANKKIASELTKRKGPVFNSFAHLSHIYSIPYKQYSELKFSRKGQLSHVDIGGWYVISFKHESEHVYLVKWDYLQYEEH